MNDITMKSDINVWSWWYTCDYDCGVWMGMGLPRSGINIWLGCHVSAQVWERIATLWQDNWDRVHGGALIVCVWVPWQDKWCVKHMKCVFEFSCW